MKCKCNLRSLMKDAGVTHRQVESATGLSLSTINKASNDKIKMIGFNTISQLCRYFDCKVGDLLILVVE